MAKDIVAANESMHLQVLTLGSGDGTLETRLVRHLVDDHASRIDLYLTDISQPLLNCAYRHAAESLAHAAQAHVWAVQCNFHHLPLYVDLCAASTNRPQRRLFCLLGETLANLDHEPRFLRQSLVNCQVGDLLLLDVQTISAACDRPEDIKSQDKLFRGGVGSRYAAWLAGPIWRHCKDVVSVDFHWNVDTYCPVPGSYAIHAVATVKSQKRADRQFSVFRFTRYDPAKLALCLRGIGWEEIAALAYAGDHSLRLYQRRADRVERSSVASAK